MDPKLVKRLAALNREFYARFARDFSETRSAERLNLDPLVPYLRSGIRLLDVGCGNGRLAERLDREGYALDYVGIDVTLELLSIARRRTLTRVHAQFEVVDIAQPGWASAVAARAPFDLALALALLHHIPGQELRRRVLVELRELLGPGGILVLSNWRFMDDERLRSKIVPWQQVGIDERAVEPGDALLDWKRGGTGYRYVHLLTAEEIQALAAASGFRVLNQFNGEADLNLWSVLQP